MERLGWASASLLAPDEHAFTRGAEQPVEANEAENAASGSCRDPCWFLRRCVLFRDTVTGLMEPKATNDKPLSASGNSAGTPRLAVCSVSSI